MTSVASSWIMLIEDDSSVADMYRVGLEQNGFRVSVAPSGEELFGAIDGTTPDVFVIDYQLPGANGADVLEAIRTNPQTSQSIAFMLSNFPQDHDGVIDRVVELGAVAWLEKVKTSPATLAERLRQALERAERTP